MSRLYKSVLPQSQKDSYGPNENIVFTLNFQGQSIKRGSIRLCGNLSMATLAATTQIDALTGIHSVWSSVVTSLNNRVIENLVAYPRLHKMKMETRQDDASTIANSVNLTSLKLARDEQTTSWLEGDAGGEHLPFSCKLDFCLNRTDADIPWRTGPIQISLRTASDVEFMVGKGTSVYSLNNLEMAYQVQEDGGKGGPVNATTYHMVKHTLDSNNISLSTRVPASCQSVACTFIKASEENSDAVNHLTCAVLPSVTRLQWSFNDSMSMVKYSVESEEEILANYLRAMGRADYNNVRVSTLDNELRTYGIGLDFYGNIDLSSV